MLALCLRCGGSGGNCECVAVSAACADGDLAVAIAVVGFANAVFLLVWSAVHEDMVWRWSGLASVVSVSSLVDVVEVLLIVWLLREMPPVRFAARYLVIPLLTVLEGLCFGAA